MSENKSEEVFLRLIEEGFNWGHLNALDELFALNFMEHQGGFVPRLVEQLGLSSRPQ